MRVHGPPGVVQIVVHGSVQSPLTMLLAVMCKPFWESLRVAENPVPSPSSRWLMKMARGFSAKPRNLARPCVRSRGSPDGD